MATRKQSTGTRQPSLAHRETRQPSQVKQRAEPRSARNSQRLKKSMGAPPIYNSQRAGDGLLCPQSLNLQSKTKLNLSTNMKRNLSSQLEIAKVHVFKAKKGNSVLSSTERSKSKSKLSNRSDDKEIKQKPFFQFKCTNSKNILANPNYPGNPFLSSKPL